MSVQVGDEKILNRPTFLHEGIFVNQGTTVKVMEVTADEGLIVQFMDREGYPHILKSVQESELI